MGLKDKREKQKNKGQSRKVAKFEMFEMLQIKVSVGRGCSWNAFGEKAFLNQLTMINSKDAKWWI